MPRADGYNRAVVLILTQCFPPAIGGIENYLGGMAYALAAARHEVTVYADASPTATDGDAPFRTRRFGGIKMLRRRRKARAAEKLMRQGNVSHLICDTWKSMEHVNPSDGARVIVLAHGSEFPVRPSANKKRRISESLRKVHRILTSSAAARERMRQGGFDTTKAEVFHPPIDEPSPVAESASAWAANHWQDRGPRILSVGRLVRRKGIDKGIRAVAGLAPRHPRLRYLIAGDGEETPALRALVSELGMEEHIHFCGQVDNRQKAALYASAQVFLLPGGAVGDDMEGFGLVFIEAGAWGVPVVAGACGGAVEAVEDGTTGRLCDSGDDDSIRDALDDLLADENRRLTLGENARRNAQRYFWRARVGPLLGPS